MDGVGRLADSQKWSWMDRVGVEELPPGLWLPGDLTQGRKPSSPVSGKLQGAHGGFGPVSVPWVRQVIFTQDPGSSWAAEKGRWCETGPLCPWGQPDCCGFQPREF